MSVNWKEWAIRLGMAVGGAVVEALTQLLRSIAGG